MIGSGVRHAFYKSKFTGPILDAIVINELTESQAQELNNYMSRIPEDACLEVDLVANLAGHISPTLKGIAGHHAAINIRVNNTLMAPIEIGGGGKYYKFPSQKQRLELNRSELENLYKAHILLRDKYYSNIPSVYVPGTNDCVSYIHNLIQLYNIISLNKIDSSKIGRFDPENDRVFAKLSRFALNVFRGPVAKDFNETGNDQSLASYSVFQDIQDTETLNRVVQQDLNRKIKIFSIKISILCSIYAISVCAIFIPYFDNAKAFYRISNRSVYLSLLLLTYLLIINIIVFRKEYKGIESVDIKRRVNCLSGKAKRSLGKSVFASNTNAQLENYLN